MRLRSTTKRISQERVKFDTSVEESNIESSPESDYVPAKKRRRTLAVVTTKERKTREYRGLSQLCIDELYVVFAYVYPMDLLNLARTCKYLRSFLMNKSSRSLWKDALDRVEDLPRCPADLTEPQYTNLVFYNRCHSCGNSAPTILWSLRRRYCTPCKAERLCRPSICDSSIPLALPYDTVTIGNNGSGIYVDKDQLESFTHDYHSSTDKEQFLKERRKLCKIIQMHAYYCGTWQRGQGRVKRFDLEVLRKERQKSIFERLRKHGYGPELDRFGYREIKGSYKAAFKQHAHLTDSEWEQMWPKWFDIMNGYRSQRLDTTYYNARRKLLVSEYDKYVKLQTPGTPTFDLLPHVADLASFPPFRDIIETPEESEMGEEPFASAFAQLPALVDEWKQQLDIRLAELVEIPPHLTLQDTSCHAVESSRAESDEAYPKGVAKLHLACALFKCQDRDLFTYREVFLAAMRYRPYPSPSHSSAANRTGAGSSHSQDQFNISFLEEIPCIVHACGLDPNVATPEDMDHRNVRLRCLVCKNLFKIVMDWRNAMLHASQFHANGSALVPLSESPRWQVISNDHIDAIQAVENSVERSRDYFQRCLLCRPRVGNALRENYFSHMQNSHGLDGRLLREGVHYERLGLEGYHLLKKVEMVEEEGQVIFRQESHGSVN